MSLAQADEVYRALIKNTWVEVDHTGHKKVTADAFYRRDPNKTPPKDVAGISVIPAGSCSIEQIKRPFIKFFGVGKLYAGDIRSLGLDVVPTSPTHANITGLPHKWDSDQEKQALAQRYAEQLAELAAYEPLGVD